jgi:hypothetical protein
MKTDSSDQLRDEQRMPLQPEEQVLSSSDENNYLSLSSNSIVGHLQQRTASPLRTEDLFQHKKMFTTSNYIQCQTKSPYNPRKTITKYPTSKMCTGTTTIMSGCGHALLHYHRNRLMAAMRRAGTQEEVFQLQRAIEEASAGRRKEMSEAGKVSWNGFVVWGPKGFEGEEREECE